MSVFGNTGFSYIVQALILGSPVFASIIYDIEEIRLDQRHLTLFYLSGLIFMLGVHLYSFKIMYYTPDLWMQYTAFIIFATMAYNTRYNPRQSICLAFLTVFLNSYYWELAIHIADYLQTFPWVQYWNVFIPQLWRLYPILFFRSHFNYKKPYKRYLAIGFILSVIVMIINFVLVPAPAPPEVLAFFNTHGFTYVTLFRRTMFLINRSVCLAILIKITLDATRDNVNCPYSPMCRTIKGDYCDTKTKRIGCLEYRQRSLKNE